MLRVGELGLALELDLPGDLGDYGGGGPSEVSFGVDEVGEE